MKIHRIRAFADNFIFVVELNGQAMVVDPGESEGVFTFLREHQLRLHSILLTHCHNDHIGGVKDLAAQNEHARILGPSRLLEFGIKPNETLAEGVRFEFQNTEWQSLHLPGHTLDHLAYYQTKEKVLFCGDVLFSLGCGRLFEGSFEQAYHSLQKVKTLPSETQIYCAHEYTLANCNFHIEENLAPHEDYLKLKRRIVDRLTKDQDTIPTPLEFELKYNSFLRASSLEEFTQLRQKRNQFKTLAK